MTVLLDTGFLLAVLDGDDDLHEACAHALQNEEAPLLPDFVVPELAYPARTWVSSTHAVFECRHEWGV